MAKKKNVQSDSIEGVEHALSRTEQFIEENQKVIMIVVGVILAVVAGYLGFKRFYQAPLEAEARSQMFMAERYFENDSFNLALNGDGNNWGFLDIIDEYKMTKSANLSEYYAGISYLHLGQFDAAIEHLQNFKSDDKIVSSIALGALGDAYTELGELDKAVSYYKKAANHNDNQFSAPIYLIKAGLIYEELGDPESALKMYERIQEEYPESTEGRKAEMYMARVKTNLE